MGLIDTWTTFLSITYVLVKLDFTHRVFNSVCRNVMREAVPLHAPSLLGHVDFECGDVTWLKIGEFVIDSSEGK